MVCNLMKKLHLVVGTRPNFIKLAPLVNALRQRKGFHFEIINTCQHYDDTLSSSFFRTLNIPQADIALEIEPTTGCVQVAKILEAIEPVFRDCRPDAVVVFGDVNSTMASAFAAVSLGIPIIHVEAGLRSFDREMPEEINRIIVDAIATLLFVTEPSGVYNLAKEGIAAEKIYLVGNIMIDTLKHLLPRAKNRKQYSDYGLKQGGYAFLTMHRPSNVDNPNIFCELIDLFQDLSERLPIIFPIHPRTRKNAQLTGIELKNRGRLKVIPPVDYLGSLSLQSGAKLVITDSGGIQEETTFLGIPCLTLRYNTERPITVEKGTSTLVGNDVEKIRYFFDQVLTENYKTSEKIALWDGNAANRIVDLLERKL